MKYRRKQSAVEAFQLGIDNIPDWFMDRVTSNDVILHGSSSGFEHHDDTTADIRSTFGTILHANYGDYIVKAVGGDIYPYKPHVFKNAFEPDYSDREQQLVSVNDVSNKNVIDFAINDMLKRFENSAFEDDQIIYNLLKRAKEMWNNIKINGIEMYGMTFEEFCDQCDEKRNIMFLSDDERKNLNKAFEIMKILSKEE